ncbi:MAG: methyltransferase [Thermoleophilaceae bacterium]
MKDLLHDWDDERCARILATARAAMPSGSRLVLLEGVLERNEVDPIVDAHMLTQTDGGRQRSVAELHALLRDAGLEPGGVRRTAGPALVEGLAPGAPAGRDRRSPSTMSP